MPLILQLVDVASTAAVQGTGAVQCGMSQVQLLKVVSDLMKVRSFGWPKGPWMLLIEEHHHLAAEGLK